MTDKVWRWRDHFGRVWTIKTIKDDHLLNVETFLLGRAKNYKLSQKFGPDSARWKRSYDTVRDEIEHRGLTINSIPTA